MTRALFLEESYDDRTYVLYTLKEQDHDGYQSLYRLYMSYDDPTELQFARNHFDSWDHWVMVSKSTWFRPFIEKWREEKDLEIRSKALANIFTVAKDRHNKQQYEANKFLLSGGWKIKAEKEAVGRPSKAKIKEEAERIFEELNTMNEDLKRISN